jgi:3-hydroxyisobutyrate dehydrogenase-like beta-hydroxyacid dehydrogenase
MKIGLVGLGRMGAAIYQRLSESGFEVTGWDHNAATVRACEARQFRIAASPRAVAAASDVVLSSITEDSGVRRIYTGTDGFLQADIAGKLFIEMSTLQPMTVRELATLVEQKGARLIDSPVLGTIPSVRDGKLFAMVGGRAEDLERARPVLEKLTRRIAHMGPVGSGHAAKLAANIGLGTYVQSLAESLAFGKQQGLTLEQVLDALSESATATPWLKAKLPTLRGEKGDVSLDIRTLRKDLMSAVATGALTGVSLPAASGALASLSAAVAHGHGDEDIAELAKFFRESMGQSYD